MQGFQSFYKTQSAVLFIVFNRPDTTQQVFEQIKNAQPARLYIAADGPRSHKNGEDELCEQVRNIAQQVDWPCKVKTLFRDNNLGCKEAVSSGIDWFFEHEEEGIILEDDCLPANSFFSFCDEMLEKYRHDTRVRHICGCNLQQGNKRGDASYYFSNLTLVWGWAGWRRVWNDYDKTLAKYDEQVIRPQLSKIFADPLIVDSWEAIFKELKAGHINTWDYQLTFLNFFNNGLSVIPNKNLVSNIGYGSNSTHTANSANQFANVPLEEIDEITHPLYFLPEKEADVFVLTPEFKLEERYHKHNHPRRQLKRWLKNRFK